MIKTDSVEKKMDKRDREATQKEESIVQTYEKSILVTNLKVPETQNGDSRQRIRRFAVDYCYDPKYPENCTQEAVYQDVGKEILDSMFGGYNACVLAYGHSASGKTYTMMGEEDDPGLTPRICQGLFQRMDEKALTTRVRFHTVISFLEIYNERVRDLLVSDDTGATSGGNFSLRVREHPKLGPYVQDLSQHIVNDKERILEYLAVGNSRRSTAATENNVHSSRSHAVFTIRFKQADDLCYESDLSSKVHLVDLAGSERAGATQSKTRLKEGANINKSLVTLGNVISALAESCETFVNPKEQQITKTWQPFVPYRDSVLTWLLKDTLGGNSNTIMIATVSPASSCLNETINTLRYAKRTKRIVNQPIINEDPKIRTIRELREEIEKLRGVIITLQTNKRDEPEIDISKSTKEDGDERAEQKESREPVDKRENDNSEVGGPEKDAISSLDILTDLSGGNEENNAESYSAIHRIAIKAPSANSFSSDVSKINDEKKTDVNGLVIDKLVHESQVFSDSLESFSVLRTKTTNRGDFCKIDGVDFRREPCNFSSYTEAKSKKKRLSPYRTYRDNQFVPKISRTSKLRIGSRRLGRHRLRLYLKRECASLENLSLPKMLHRSRPDLIKGIVSQSKDGLPSTSSQSFTDVSGLSQSASENSLNSSGSVDSQTSGVKVKWLEKGKEDHRTKLREDMKSGSRQSSIGDGSGSSTPTQIPKPVPKRRASDKRSEIVAAVTTRLYATKKKPDPRMEALQAAEKDDDDDGELEELKLCKRARMKLFDLSRKLAMAKRMKKTADSDTQTDFVIGTIRVKEKCIATDQSGIVQYESSSTNTPSENLYKKEKPIIMNQVFIPSSSNYVVECGRSVRVEVPRTAKSDSGTQTVCDVKDQTTSPSNPNEDNFSDDSLEDDEVVNWKKNCEMNSLEMKPVANNSCVKSRSNENIPRPSFDKRQGRSYDSLVETKSEKPTERIWLPITRYPIAGTNFLYEYDPNRSSLIAVHGNTGNEPKKESDDDGNKIRRTEIILPLLNGLPLAICTETVSSSENVVEDTMNYLTLSNNMFLSEENASSENSLVSNEGSDVTSSSETSSEDFVFYEGPREKETSNRPSGLGNLYTISENSELSDITASDPSSPQPSQYSSLQLLEQRKENDVFTSTHTEGGNTRDGAKNLNKDYTVGVHVLRNPLIKLNSQRECRKNGCTTQRPGSIEQEITDSVQEEKQVDVTPDSSSADNDSKPKQKKGHDRQPKKINWSDIQTQSQRQFLNFNILSSSKQTPFTIDSNIFGEKKQTSEAKFPSEDSITFVFMGPNRQKTSMLMEIIKRTLGQGSDQSFSERSQKKSRNRGVQCKLMRSVSVDTAMLALSRFAKHQCPTVDIPRTSSLDTLVPEEMQMILDQGRLHGVRESSCQCGKAECQCQRQQVVRYTTSTSTTRDQGTETDRFLETTDKSSMTSFLVDASCDALEESEDNLFDEYFPPLPRTTLSMSRPQNATSHWKDMKDVILGTVEYRRNEGENSKRPRKAVKSVSWSDLSESDGVVENFDEKMTDSSDEVKAEDCCPPNKSNGTGKNGSDSAESPDFSSQTRRVRFIEPHEPCLDEICHILHEKKEAAETAANVTAFLKEAVQLLRNLNNLSDIYDLKGEKSSEGSEEKWRQKSSLKKVETSVQTEGQNNPRLSLSAESSPIRRARTSTSLSERKDRSMNLTWPRRRPTALGKPPTGLKPLKQLRSPLSFRSPSIQSSFDFLKNDIESSSASTNWNISNLSTTFSNSNFGDSGCSRPSSSKSFYSDGNRYWRPRPLPHKTNLDLEMDLMDSCRRLELAVVRDRMREETSTIKLSNLNTTKYSPNWCSESRSSSLDEGTKSMNKVNEDTTKYAGSSRKFKPTESMRDTERTNYIKKKPCKCYCHYKNTYKVYRSSLELEADPPVERHCHACCTPCVGEPERSNSAPALNSICDSEGNKCRLFYYGYCPCSNIKLKHVKSSPRAYMQHLLSLRRQIVKNTYDSTNNT